MSCVIYLTAENDNGLGIWRNVSNFIFTINVHRMFLEDQSEIDVSIDLLNTYNPINEHVLLMGIVLNSFICQNEECTIFLFILGICVYD